MVKLDLLGNGELNLGDWALGMRTICLFASQQQPAGLLVEVTVALLPFLSLSLSLWCGLNLLSLHLQNYDGSFRIFYFEITTKWKRFIRTGPWAQSFCYEILPSRF